MFSAAKPDDKLKTNKEAAIISRRFNSKPSGNTNSCSFYGNTYELAGIVQENVMTTLSFLSDMIYRGAKAD
ncbi:hypothetical protein ACLBR5_14795 [Escherichia coli]